MVKTTVFMFSGQGSHYYHMGRELYDNHPGFRDKIEEFDAVAKEIFGRSIAALLYDPAKNKGDQFNQTMITSPAIIMVEYALAGVLMELGIEPDLILGASLGEISGLLVAGVRSLPEILAGTKQRLELFEEHCAKGKMIGILNSPNVYKETPLLNLNSEIAAINYKSHFVISCRHSVVKKIETYLKENNVIYQTLDVSHGFHSTLLDPVKELYINTLKGTVWRRPCIPLISCATTSRVTEIEPEYLWRIFRDPILFQSTIEKIEAEQDCIYIDLGPSGTLANFAKYNLKKNSGSQVLSILTPFGQDMANLDKVRKFYSDVEKKEIKKERSMTKMMKTYVFPGQGAQAIGMGGTLFDDFTEMTRTADDVLGYSIKRLCLEDPEKQLNHTQYTQPALFVVNSLSYLKRCQEDDRLPDFVAGHSLGEYNALHAAGAVDFETGLRLVKKRGELMGQAVGGAMAAVLKLTEEQIFEILKENDLTLIDVANFNTPSQIVISGPKEAIAKAQPLFQKSGGTYIPLKVSAAFHSRYMQSAKEAFEIFLKEITFSDLKIPLISNVHARPYDQKRIAANLADQLRSSVKWTESIRYLMGRGAMEFIEIGHGNVLTRMIKQIQAEATPLILSDETEKEDLDAVENSTAAETPDGASESIAVAREAVSEEPEKNGSGNNKEPVSKAITEERTEMGAAETSALQNSPLPKITAASLGSAAFKEAYNLKYAYVTGAMVRGIASKEMVVRMGRAGMMGYFGSGGLGLDELETAIIEIQQELAEGQAYGINLLNSPLEKETVDLFLKYKVKHVEAAAYMLMTPALVKYRLRGLTRRADGSIAATNRIMAKVSRPEVAAGFLSPAPERIVRKLLEENVISAETAEMSERIPMADELCVEADSGGHTDGGMPYALMPAMIKLRDEMKRKHQYTHAVGIGAAGGIGTPEAAAAAFILGADFILTGSINQCTVEAGTSDLVKELLQDINVQDTEYAPAGDMFEMGAKVQVLRRGVFFPARANKLYDLYKNFASLDDLDEKTSKQIQERYFKRSFEEVYEEVKSYWPPDVIANAERNPKQKMALIFRWYFGHTSRLAREGNEKQRVDFQVHCGPALGAFNQWVKNTELNNWKNRHVDQIGIKLMHGTAEVLNGRFQGFMEKLDPNFGD